MTQLEQARDWFRFLFVAGDNVEVRCIQQETKKVESLHFKIETLGDQWKQIKKLNQEGYNIYAGINPRKSLGGTTNDDAASVGVIVVDVENIVLETILERISGTDLLDPHMVLTSGHGCHCYWRLKERLTDFEKWGKLQDRLAVILGGDRKIKDAARIMRVPGFTNHKPPKAEAVLHHICDGAFELEHLEKVLAPPKPLVKLVQPMPVAKSAVDRGRNYLSKIPGAIEGQGGDAQTYNAAIKLVHVLKLEEQDAWALMNEYNLRCEPPWTEKELRHKLKCAMDYRGGSSPPPRSEPHRQPSVELPVSDQFERCMVSCALQDKDALAEVMGVIPLADMLYHPLPKMAYNAAIELNLQGKGIDLVLLEDYLKRTGNEVEHEALSSLFHAMKTFDNVLDYANLVLEEWMTRQMGQIGVELTEESLSTVSPKETLSNYEQRLGRLSEAGDDGKPQTSKQVSDDVAELVKGYRSGSGFGIGFGIPSVDKVFYGMAPSSVTILAGRPGGGKSKLAGNVLANLAKGGMPIMVYNLEMTNKKVGLRIACSLAEVNHYQLVNRYITDEQNDRLNDAIDFMATLPIHWQDKPGLKPMELRASLRRMKRKHGIQLAVIDHVLLMQTDKSTSHRTRNDEVGEVSRMVKLCAKETEIPILALCQMNRGIENRNDCPRLSDLRDSGNIEQDADNVLFLHKPKGEDDQNSNNIVELHIAKQREGPQGVVDLLDRREIYRFDEAPQKFRAL